MTIKDFEKYFLGRAFTDVGDSQIVHDDNFKWLPNETVDLILTDPPFNIARDTNFHTWEKNTINSYRFDQDKGWDSYTPRDFRELLSLWSKEFFRVLRPGGTFAVFCADEYVSDLISSLRDAGLKPRRTITWRKPNAVPVNRKHMMMSACEYIVMGVKGSKSTFNVDIMLDDFAALTSLEIIAIADKAAAVMELEIRRALSEQSKRLKPKEIEGFVKSIVESSSKTIASRAINIYNNEGTLAELCVPNYVLFNSKSGNRLHPTEKPVNLLRYLTELFSEPGAIILDPFAGSASTGEAALLSGRKALLVEREKEFFDKGSVRMESLVNRDSYTLFD